MSTTTVPQPPPPPDASAYRLPSAPQPQAAATGAHPYRRVGALGTWLVSLLTAATVFTAFTVFASVVVLGQLDQALDGAVAAPAPVVRALLRYDLMAGGQVMTWLLIIPIFLTWFHRAYRNLWAFDVGRRRSGPGWAVGSWFVPFANLVIPKRIFNDIWLGSRDAGASIDTGDAAGRRALLPVHVWWLFWLTSVTAQVFAAERMGRLLESAPLDVSATSTNAVARDAMLTTLAADTLSALAGVAALVLVATITVRQERAVIALRGTARPAWRMQILFPVGAALVAAAMAGLQWTTPDPIDIGMAGALAPSRAAAPDSSAPGEGERTSLAPPVLDESIEVVEPVEEQNANASGTVGVEELEVGDCFDAPLEDGEVIDAVQRIPCDEPHDNEVYALVNLTAAAADPYPGDEEVIAAAEDACIAPFGDYVGTPYVESELWSWVIYPDRSVWNKGDRTVLCILDGNGQPLIGSAAGTRR